MASLESKLIAQERKQSSFSIKEMTYLIDGGKHKTALRHDIGKYFAIKRCNFVVLL